MIKKVVKTVVLIIILFLGLLAGPTWLLIVVFLADFVARGNLSLAREFFEYIVDS